MTKRPFTDLHEIIKQEVCEHMKPFIEATMMEHEETRRVVKQNTDVLERVGMSKLHTWVQYFLIGMLFIGMIIVITGCLII